MDVGFAVGHVVLVDGNNYFSPSIWFPGIILSIMLDNRRFASEKDVLTDFTLISFI